VELVERALMNSSKAGDMVGDLFGGSGSTLIACERRGRKARMMEIDPRYCDVIIRRYQEYTGQQAVLDGDGRTFTEVSLDRANAVPGDESRRGSKPAARERRSRQRGTKCAS
jgi:16S rRNA G966 N2-methylase RsmD